MPPLSFDHIISFLLAFSPVVLFLIGLVLIDSFKLVPFWQLIYSILGGMVTAYLCFHINPWLSATLDIDWDAYRRYLGPTVEEPFKAILLIGLIRAKRVGFMVDAAIYGFAIGAGFAILENLDYLRSIEPGLATWVVRGFGTAIMHGGATALMGIVSMFYASTHGASRPWVYLPGLVLAIGVHTGFNQFVLSPEHMTLLQIVALFFIIGFVYRVSERRTRDWLGVEFDTDAELLEMINTGKTNESRIGEYFKSLQTSFPGEVVADMLCMLRLHLELSVRAKGILLMREAGFKIQREPDIEERLAELKYLEGSIGRTGLRAVSPMLNMSDKDLWQLHTLLKG